MPDTSNRRQRGPEILFDYDQAAEILGCTPRLVRKLVETRQLASVKVGALVRIDPDDLAEYVDRQRRDAVV
jgi:excisionase family DNA binding protein